MGFRFRRSFKIFPGIRLNLSKSGFSSITYGDRKSSIKVNMPLCRRGPGTVTVGSLGGIFTGMSYTESLPGTTRRRNTPVVGDRREALRLDQERRMQKLLDEQAKRKSS